MAVWEKYSKLFIVVPISPRFDPRRESLSTKKTKKRNQIERWKEKEREREREREIDRQREREREIERVE